MDLFDVAKSCARRWYVFLPLMVVTVLVGYRVYAGVEPVYYSTTTLGLANPSVSVVPADNEVRSNGLVDAGGAVLLINLLAMSLKDPAVTQQIAEAGGISDYTATVFETGLPGNQLPLVTIEATASDPETSKKTVELVAAQSGPLLERVQRSADVPPDRMLISYTVVPPVDPQPATPSRTRSTVALMLVGTGLSVFVAVLFDVLVVRLKTKRNDRDRVSDVVEGGQDRDTDSDREWTRVGSPAGKGSPGGERP
ncbi:hypothetical protein [Rhodococcus sp. NPDC003383]